MKCKCSLTNEYEIIGLCDIQKFNKKISGFEDKSWTQISISDNLILSGNKPSIRSIAKTFVTVQITSSKLINTPKSNAPNIEGMSLTGKLLLVAGEIVQRVLYVSNNTNSEKVNSFKIKTPFTTYIVAKENADISMDKYCVYVCVEYASLRLINDKSLSQNVTLFLFAHLMEACKAVIPPGPDPDTVIYPNEIIFNTRAKDKELAKIKFDPSKNTLEVTSTEHFEQGSREAIIEIELFSSDGVTKKESSHILSSTNATKLVNDLNGKGFEYGDIINIAYFRHPDRVKITNHPSQGEEYDPKFTNNEAFIITKKGLVSYILLSKIRLKDSNNQPIVELNFSKIDKKLRVISTGITTPSTFTARDYFKIVLNKSNGRDFTGIIKGNEDGTILKGSLDMQSYSIGDTIDVFSEEPNKLEITNYPDEGTLYNLTDKLERFKITDNGLEKIAMPKGYPSEIILKNDTNQELSRIKFNITSKALEVTSTSNIQSSLITSQVKLYKISTGDIFEEIIDSNQNASQFVTALNGIDYLNGDVIEIASNIGTVAITNYPNLGDNYNSEQIIERFRITDRGLVKMTMRPVINTEIKFINASSSDHLVSVKFDSIASVLRVEDHSRGAFNDSIPTKFELYGLDGTTLKASGEISSDTNNMSPFVNDLNGISYKIGYIIKISYGRDPEKFLIENFNPNRRDYEKGFDNNQAFIIEERGLTEYLLVYKLSIWNIADVYFSKFDNKIKVISSAQIAPSKEAQDKFPDYFKLILYRNNQAPLIVTIPYSQDSSSFKQALGEQMYSVGDTLSIMKDSEFSTRIEDFTVSSGGRIIDTVSRYEITQDWLERISATYPNDIVFKDDNDNDIARVRFILSTGKLFVTRTNNIITSRTRRPVLQFRLYASDGTTLKANGIISEGAQAISFVDDLNDKGFNFNDIIKIGYGNFPRRINITGFPQEGHLYIPTFKTTESFVIKQAGLVPYMLQNSIQVFNRGNQAIAEVSFDRLSRQIKVISTGNLASDVPTGTDYFKVTLKKSNPNQEFTGIIQKNQDARVFKGTLDGKTYDLGDEIEIFCEEPSKVAISNLYYIGNRYNLTQKTEIFTITDTELQKI